MEKLCFKKKRILMVLLLTLTFLIGFDNMTEIRVFADTTYKANYPRLVDKADVLTDEEEEKLLNKLNKISEEEEVDVVVLTVKNEAGDDITAFADDYYDYNYYGFGDEGDGIILVLDYGTRDWAISTKGKGIDIFTDAGQKYMTDKFLPYLSDGKGYKGFDTYADLSSKFIKQYKTGYPYDVGNLPKEETNTPSEDYGQRRKERRLVDRAGVLSMEERIKLNSKIDVASYARNADIAILTLKNETTENDILSYAKKFYTDNNFGIGSNKDGILFVIDYGTDAWTLYTSGKAVYAFPDDGQDILINDFLPLLKEGKANEGLSRYIADADRMLSNYESGKNYDEGLVVKKKEFQTLLKDSVYPALFFSLILCIFLTAQLKTVKPERKANNYAIRDSFYLSDAQDLFLYKTLSKSRRTSSSSGSSSGGGSRTHRSSSGSRHGGSRGKF